MVAVEAPPMILGERPDSRVEGGESGEPPPFWERRPARPRFAIVASSRRAPSLPDLVQRLEAVPTGTFTLREADLPLACRTRTALIVLQRRAERSAKTIELHTADPDLRLLALSAGIGRQASGGAVEGETRTGLAAPGQPGARSDAAGATTGASATAEPHEPRDLQPPGQVGPEETRTGARRATSAGHQVPRDAGDRARAGATLGAVRLASSGILDGFTRALGAAGRSASSLRSAPAAQRVRVPARVAPAAAVAGMAASLLLAMAAVVMPAASIQLTPAAEQWTAEIPIVVDPSIRKSDVVNGRLPGRAVSKEVADTKQVPTTGRKAAPDARAAGEVVFINKSDKTLTVPKGSVVLAGTVKFATQSDVSVSGTVFAGPQQRWGMGRASILAVDGGPAGNVDRFRINKLEGPLAASLDVQNDAPTRGGSDKTIAYVTADDRKKLQEALYGLLADRLAQQLKGQPGQSEKETAVPWAGQNPAVVEATFNKNEGEEATSVSLTMKLRYGVTVFANDAYNDLIRQIAERSGQVDAGHELVRGTLQPQPPSIGGVENGGQLRLAGRAVATAVPRVDAGKLRGQLTNRSLSDTRALLDGLPGIVSYNVRAWPSWLGRMPLLGFRISVASQLPPAKA